MLNDVIICALNEDATIAQIVSVFTKSPGIRTVHVLIDSETTDDTARIAYHYGAHVFNGTVHGKGNLLSEFWSVWGMALTSRIILCDADYTLFPPSIPSRLTPVERGMHLIVPCLPTTEQWRSSDFGRRIPFRPNAWAANTGLRSIPRDLLTLPLHGYLVETQLNRYAMDTCMPVTREYVKDLKAPLRFTEKRLKAMEADRQYGIEHGILPRPVPRETPMTTEELAQLIANNDHDQRLSYGALHIVIADENVDADSIRWCLSRDNTSSQPLTDLERQIGEELLNRRIKQRRRVLARAEEILQARKRMTMQEIINAERNNRNQKGEE